LRKVFGFAFAAVMPFVVAGAFLTPLIHSPADPDSEWLADQTLIAPDHGIYATSTDGDDESAVDLLGNPVSDAIAKYKMDATGGLYELHSPQTEIPRLAAPKS
jgi:hypothetical protein